MDSMSYTCNDECTLAGDDYRCVVRTCLLAQQIEFRLVDDYNLCVIVFDPCHLDEIYPIPVAETLATSIPKC